MNGELIRESWREDLEREEWADELYRRARPVCGVCGDAIMEAEALYLPGVNLTPMGQKRRWLPPVWICPDCADDFRTEV